MIAKISDDQLRFQRTLAVQNLGEGRTTLTLSLDYVAICDELLAARAEIERLRALAKPAEWVAIEERLPTKPDHYLICRAEPRRPEWPVFVSIAYFRGDKYFFTGQTETAKNVVAWRELPLAPHYAPKEKP